MWGMGLTCKLNEKSSCGVELSTYATPQRQFNAACHGFGFPFCFSKVKLYDEKKVFFISFIHSSHGAASSRMFLAGYPRKMHLETLEMCA